LTGPAFPPSDRTALICGLDRPDAPALNAAEPTDAEPAALAEWKDTLRRQFERWLASIDRIPELDEPEEFEVPDLYSFYTELATASAEARRANRRAAEAFSQWGETLAQFESDLRLFREQFTRLAGAGAAQQSLSRTHCLVLVELLDRMQRVACAFGSPPAGRWWHRTARWREAWETQRQAFDILVGHLEALLKKEGVTRIETLDSPFDPAVMTAVAAEFDPDRAAHTVAEEISAGYRRHGELLRPAQVKVTVKTHPG
jgi:hypothetical protein